MTNPSNDGQRYITVAIHTYEKAIALKAILESEGVEVILQNVNLESPHVAAGVRLRIKENDLPRALRIIENQDIFCKPCNIGSDGTTTPPVIIVPVDFSTYSLKAAEIAFKIAAVHHASILLIHSFVDPAADPVANQFSDSLTYDVYESSLQQTSLENEAETMMKHFQIELKNKIKQGEIPPVKFDVHLEEGVPEDVIVNEAKEIHPMLVVMGTRGADKKQRELIGSVTAEVLDSCRYPVLTVTEGTRPFSGGPIDVVYFSSLDQEDMLAIDELLRLFPSTAMKITLVNVPSRRRSASSPTTDAMKSLLQYCRDKYPAVHFDAESIAITNVIEDYRKLSAERHIDLIAVPSKKRNVFARLFNPGIPHRLLFHTDIPMMVIPV